MHEAVARPTIIHFPLGLPSASPGPGVCLAPRWRAPVSPAMYPHYQDQRQQELMWISVNSPELQLILVGSSSLSLLSLILHLLSVPDYLLYGLQTPGSDTKITALLRDCSFTIVHSPSVSTLTKPRMIYNTDRSDGPWMLWTKIMHIHI